MAENEVIPTNPAPAESVAAPVTPVTETAEPVKAEPLTRREAIAKALDEKPEGDVPRRTSEKDRDDKGKFVPQVTAVAKKERKYPSSFKPDYKPIYEELAANEKYQGIIDEIDRREGEYHKGIEPYKESANFAQGIRKVLQPYEQTLRALNVPPEQAIDALLRAETQMRNGTPEQKRAYFMQLAQQYGVPLGDQQEAAPVDPYVQALWQQQQQTQQALNQFLSTQQKHDMESANTSIEAFKKDHEHLDDVRTLMADLIDKGLAKGLDDAYEQAIWSNPVIRAKVLAKQNSDAEAKRKEDARKTVEAAKTAAVQIKGAPSTGNSATRPPSGRNRRETIEKLMG